MNQQINQNQLNASALTVKAATALQFAGQSIDVSEMTVAQTINLCAIADQLNGIDFNNIAAAIYSHQQPLLKAASIMLNVPIDTVLQAKSSELITALSAAVEHNTAFFLQALQMMGAVAGVKQAMQNQVQPVQPTQAAGTQAGLAQSAHLLQQVMPNTAFTPTPTANLPPTTQPLTQPTAASLQPTQTQPGTQSMQTQPHTQNSLSN